MAQLVQHILPHLPAKYFGRDDETKTNRLRDVYTAVVSTLIYIYFFKAWVPAFGLTIKLILLQLCCAAYTWYKLETYERSDAEIARQRANVRDTPYVSENQRHHLRKRLSVFDLVKEQTVNPFVNLTWRIDRQERIRLTLMSVTLFPLRVFFIALSLLVGWAIAVAVMYGLPEPVRKGKEPLPESRRVYLLPLRWVARSIMFWAGFLWIETKGRKATQEEAPVVIANHIGFVDPIFMLYAFLPSPVGAAEHLAAPIVGDIVRALQTITIDRRDPDSRKAVVNALKTRSQQKGWPQILIFPEGTTTNGKALVTFKPGAFLAGSPVQPVCLRFRPDRCDPSWVSAGPSQLSIIFRLCCELYNPLEVHYLPVYVPNDAEKADPVLFAKNVRRTMADAMGLPATEHSFEDVMLQREALNADLPPDTIIQGLEISQIQRVLDVTLTAEQLKAHLERFRKMDKSGKGTITMSEFMEFFQVRDSPELEHLFHLLDVKDAGEIDFREYLLGLGCVANSGQARQVKLAFRMFDLNHDEKIDLGDLRRIFHRTFPELSDEDATSILGRLEVDADGKIGYEAFEKFALSDPRFVQAFSDRVFTHTPAE